MRNPEVASRWVVLLVTLALLVPLASCALPAGASADPTTISDLRGEVLVQRQGSEEWVNAISGMRLEEGDRLRTGEGGHVLLVFFEGSVREVEADSEILIEEVSVDADTGSTMVKL